MKLKHFYTGKSMLELKKENPNLFLNDWWEDEAFSKEHPKKGRYEIELKKSFNKTFKEQKKECPKGWEVAHPAVVLEAIFNYYKKNNKYLLSDFWVRTNRRGSDGSLVYVGNFDSDGVNVYSARPDISGGNLAVSFSRRLDTFNFDTLSLCPEAEITEIRVNNKLYRLVE